jgi:hypothetical protein
MASHRRRSASSSSRQGASARQGAGIVAAALACLLLAPVLSLAAPAGQPVGAPLTSTASGPAR